MSKKPEDRINDAIQLAINFGGIDGAHHKAWVIDQMVRALTGGKKQSGGFGASKEYKKIVKDATAGEDGPDTYDWDEGIAP